MENREKVLLELFRTDSHKAVSDMIDLYGGGVSSICSHILRGCNRSLTEDAVQDTFVRLWESLSKGITPKTSLKAYVYQTARNCAISHLRSYQRQNNLSLEQLQYTGIEELVASENNTEKQADNAENYKIVHQVVESMDEPDRSIFILRFFYNHTIKEISRKLGLKEDNIESRIRRNRIKLKEKLEKRGVFYE